MHYHTQLKTHHALKVFPLQETKSKESTGEIMTYNNFTATANKCK